MGKQKKITHLRFPGFKDNWENNKIGELTNVSAGATPSTLKKEYWGGNIRWMNSGELNLKRVFEVDNRITEFGLQKSSTKLLPKHCVLIGLAGQGKTRGTVAMNLVELCTNQSIAAIHPNNKFISDFIYHNLDNRYEELRGLSKGDGGRGGLNLQIIKSLEISLPSIPEQTKIATFLNEIDKRLQALKQKKNLLEQYKKGVMQQIFLQELRFKDDNGNDFADWEEKNGNAIFDSISDKKHNSDLPILAITQEFGAIPRDLIDYTVSVTDKSVESYKVVQIGDFIISLRSFQGGIEYSNYKGICSPAYIILRPHIYINNFFFKTYFKTESYIKELQKNLEGIRDGKMISFKYFSDIKLPFPCIEEQTKIADFISAVDDKINHCQSQIEKTEVWKKGLLQQMFV
jgi:type I restriction enzyme S subunit